MLELELLMQRANESASHRKSQSNDPDNEYGGVWYV